MVKRNYITLGLGSDYLDNKQKLALRHVEHDNDSRLITFLYQPHARRNIEESILANKNNLYGRYLNMYDYFQEIDKDILRRSNTIQESRIIDDDLVLNPIDASIVEARNGNELKAKIFTLPGTYQEIERIEFYDKDGKIFKIDVYDWRGFKSSSTLYDNNGKQSQQLYFDNDGKVKLIKQLVNLNDMIYVQQIILYEKNNIKQFQSDIDLFKYFIRKSDISNDKNIVLDEKTILDVFDDYDKKSLLYMMTDSPYLNDSMTGKLKVKHDFMKISKLVEGILVYSKEQEELIKSIDQDIDVEVFDLNKLMNDYKNEDTSKRLFNVRRILYAGEINDENRVNLLMNVADKIDNAVFILSPIGKQDDLNDFSKREMLSSKRNFATQAWINNHHVQTVDLFKRSDVFVYAGDQSITNEILMALENDLKVIAIDNGIIRKGLHNLKLIGNDIDKFVFCIDETLKETSNDNH